MIPVKSTRHFISLKSVLPNGVYYVVIVVPSRLSTASWEMLFMSVWQRTAPNLVPLVERTLWLPGKDKWEKKQISIVGSKVESNTEINFSDYRTSHVLMCYIIYICKHHNNELGNRMT